MNYLNWDMQFMLGLSAATRSVLSMVASFAFYVVFLCFLGNQKAGKYISYNVGTNRLLGLAVFE